jgi:hypothetical protein
MLYCLQAIGINLTTADDVAAARLACASWSHRIPLQNISVNLAGEGDSSGNQGPQPLQSMYDLLACMQQQGHVTRGIRQVRITVPAAGMSAGSAAAPSSHCSNCNIPSRTSCMLEQFAAILAQLSTLDSISIISRHSVGSRGLADAAAAGPGILASVLQPLLLQQQLQGSLTSLSLSLASWPAGHELAALLQQLQGLRRLTLQQCPLAVICQLPSMQQLQQLSITGLLTEPVPAGYSFKRGPMLPQLPQLISLQLRSMPLDLRLQELEAIEAAACAAMRQQQQQAQHRPAVLLGLPAALARAAARSNTSNSGSIWQRGQWVGSSIAAQCPALCELRSDLELGPAVLQLQHLTTLHGAHPAWLEAAAAAAAAAQDTSSATNKTQHLQTSSLMMLPQLRQLQHLGVGVDTAADCRSLAQLKNLKSLMAWSSSSCKQRRQQQSLQAATAARKASRKAGCSDSCLGSRCGVGCGAAPSLQLVLCQGLGHSLSRLVVDGAWGVSSSEVEQVLQQCRQLKLLQVTARAC